MKKRLAMLLALALLLSATVPVFAQEAPTAEAYAELEAKLAAVELELEAAKVFDPSEIIDWYNESDVWRTVVTGHWSTNPADQMSDEDLAKAFSMAAKQQTAVQFASNFYVVIKDPEMQRAALVSETASNRDVFVGEGTVTILIFEDQMITEEQGHVNPYGKDAKGEEDVRFYMYSPWPYQASGFVTGMFGLAAASLGYYTHYYAGVSGPLAVTDVAEKYKSLSHFVKDDYVRAMGVSYKLGEEPPESVLYPVKGNCICVGAVVVGKPNPDEPIETWATAYARPENWVIWNED